MPWFIGQTDTLLVFAGVFLLLFTVAIIRLILRLIVLPATLVSPGQRAKFEVVGARSLIALYTPGDFYWVAALLVAVTDFPDFASPLRRMADAVGRVARSPRKKKETPLRPKKVEQLAAATKTAAQMVLVLGLLLAPAEVIAAPCSSYYISEITLVSVADAEAGRVQTFVGFGLSKEEAEKNALGSCSHIQLDLETCLASDRILGRNAPSDETNISLHLKYTKAVKRITGCD